ncbi:hypothetical protein AArcSl_1660 [Halalkaliarchaeum desulfuricum]|uniref:Uncharacterized protein n=1 Tax=Halalkaliarchaeum desulfuricum TaxID=2055893 RepID=A0A343TJL7_9EURY|nr:hypothetical protein [Halalkaliarchaeum desulfuricum]AUX09289.1 hypothetical protein AArcSl_1660 [Halalkaliarchaeum desulfuricum]
MILQVNPSVPAITTEQFLVGVLLLAAAFAITAVVALRLRYTGLDDHEAEVVASVRRQLAARSPGTVRISRDEDLEARREDIRRAFDATGAVEDVVTLRQAYRSIRAQAGEAARPYLEIVPRPARRFAALAVVVLVFGTVAVASETLYQWLLVETRPLAPEEWPMLAITESQAALSILQVWIAATPVIGATAEWLFVIGVLVGEWVYRRPWLFGVLLLAVAGRIVRFDRAGAERVAFPLPTPTLVAKLAAGMIGAGWVAAMLVIGAARVVAAAEPAYWGALVLVGVGLWILVTAGYAAVRAGSAILESYRQAADDDTRGRLLVRLIGIGLAVIVAPVVPVWVVVAIGSLPELVGAFLVAETAVQLLVVLVALGVVAAGVYVVREATDDVQAALREVLSRRGWQAAVFGRAVPLGLVVLAYLLARPWGFGRPASVVIGVVVGVAAAGLWQLSLRLRDRVELSEASNAAHEVVVHAYRVETKGSCQHLARINGTLVAAPDQEGPVDAVLEQCREAFRDERRRPTVGSAHARMLTEDGIVDPAETERRLRAEARSWIEGTVHREYGVDYDRLADRLERQVPPEIAQEELDRAPKSPTTPVQYRKGLLVPSS